MTHDEHPPDSSPNPVEGTSKDALSRADLISRARAFITSPQIRHEPVHAKRAFLHDKGLTEPEIDDIIRSLPIYAPPVPPRTYPPPPASNLPNVLLGVFRIFTWIAGGSATVLLFYCKYLFPRLARSYGARHALKLHQSGLLQRLTNSLTSLKETQAQTFAVLPQPQPWVEDTRYKDCTTVADLLAATPEPQDIPNIPLLRCALHDLSETNKDTPATADALFVLLQSRISWLSSEKGSGRLTSLWTTLNTLPCFKSSPLSDDAPQSLTWQYILPPNPLVPADPPNISSFRTLKAALPAPAPEHRYQHTLQSLIDLTGYLTTQAYGSTTSFRPFGASQLGPREEEIRREIRALKGLVLNRRTFLPPSRSATPVAVS